jgi:hypothetical protein
MLEDTILKSYITRDEIGSAIHDLRKGKSAGPDDLIPEFVKEFPEIILPYLEVIFNTIFDTGSFPKTWAKVIIIPVHKSGATNAPDNFRGISLLSIFGKVFTTILTKRVTVWTECYGLLNEAQAGFRKGYRTVDNITSVFGRKILGTFQRENVCMLRRCV